MHLEPKTRPPRDWDVIAVASLFIAGCLIVSIVLPLWPHGQEAVPAAGEPAAEIVQSAPTIVPSPQQLHAAGEAYGQGTRALRDKHYTEAATDFKKALERYPAFTEAYVGLADAAIAVGDTQAAVLNAQHALDLWTNDQTLHVNELTPDGALAWTHRLLGTALVRRADGELREQKSLLGKMDANRALFHCRQALSLQQNDANAQRCAKTASDLTAKS